LRALDHDDNPDVATLPGYVSRKPGGVPRAIPDDFIKTPGTLATSPSEKSAGELNRISMVWLAGSAASVLRRSVHVGLI
jgi:hypothetical protein